MDRLFAAQGATGLQLGLDLALEYGKREACNIQCHEKERQYIVRGRGGQYIHVLRMRYLCSYCWVTQ